VCPPRAARAGINHAISRIGAIVADEIQAVYETRGKAGDDSEAGAEAAGGSGGPPSGRLHESERLNDSQGLQIVPFFSFLPPGNPLKARVMGDTNPKNNQKKKAQQSAKKTGNQKKPATPAPAARKK
jgi:hypothetical protein